MAFKIAGSMAFKEAAREAKPVLLEPVMFVEVTVPEEYTGTISGDLNSRRGRIERMEMVGGMQAIKATVPLSNMFGYAIAIRGSTKDRANFSMEFKQYEETPLPWDFGDDGPYTGVALPKHPQPRSPQSGAVSKPDFKF
jgi:elongation factor G